MSVQCHHPPSTILLSARPKLSCGYKTGRGRGVTSLNCLPTGGEAAAPARRGSCSPLLTHPGFTASAVSSRNEAKARRASGELMKAPGDG